ncbi:hypothetical protein LBMAG53_03320 [Planctomycetota bacterium]|nr:hypothetical protein LBMAG53_03320 [Planctomycetota bacterium]
MVVEGRADCTGRNRALVVWIEPAGCTEPAADRAKLVVGCAELVVGCAKLVVGCAELVPAGLLEALAERTDPLCCPPGRSICASGRP